MTSIRVFGCALLLALAQSASAQIIPGGVQLVFAPNGSATTQSGSSGTVLGTAGPNDLLSTTPLFTASAEKVLTLATANALLGDEDFDGDHFEDILGGIDAVEVLRFPPSFPFNPFAPVIVYDYVFSSVNSFGGSSATVDNPTRGAANGSIFRIVPGAGLGDSVEIVLSEQQILSAIGQGAPGDDVDTDAFAQDDFGNVFLSFADDELLNGTPIGDGALIMLDTSALSYAPNGVVTGVVAGSAVLLLGESEVDAMVANSGLTTASAIGDLSALTFDYNNGGTFLGLDGNAHPNLLFAGESLGPVVLTTDSGGSIGFANGIPVGSATPNPADLGLGSMTGGIGALTMVDDKLRAIAIDEVDGEVDFIGGENLVEWDIGNCFPDASVVFVIGVSPGAPGAQPTSVYTFGYTFPTFFPVPVITNLVFNIPTDSNGIAVFSAILPHSISPHVLVVQAFDPNNFQLSAPAAMWFP